MLSLPHKPQLEMKLSEPFGPEFSASLFTSAARSTFTLLFTYLAKSSRSALRSRTIVFRTRRKTAASSSSLPGVRMVVAEFLRPIRISSGSSRGESSPQIFERTVLFFRRRISFPGPMLAGSFSNNEFPIICLQPVEICHLYISPGHKFSLATTVGSRTRTP